MTSKSDTIRARLPRGLADREPAEIRAVDAMVRKITSVYERYGFDPLETPAIEYTEALGKFLPDEDRPGQGVFSFQDDDEQWLSLRYDLTAPLARYVAENYDKMPKPFRSYRAGWVFRNEKPGPGRFRQFMQLDADTVGSSSPAADAEMAMMMADTLDALGLTGKYVVKVSNRKLLDGVLDLEEVNDEEARLQALRAIDKRDRLEVDGVRALLGAGRTDKSGDFTPGVGLKESSVLNICRVIGLQSVIEVLDEIDWSEMETDYLDDLLSEPEVRSNVAKSEQDFYEYEVADRVWRRTTNEERILGLEHTIRKVGFNTKLHDAISELKEIARNLTLSGYGPRRICIDPSVVRGLEYYTGPVFEAELTFPVQNEKGQQVVFGSVGGGGRYDGLVSRFRKEPVPATGFSIGVSRLKSALESLPAKRTERELRPFVIVLSLDDDTARFQKMVSDIRKDATLRRRRIRCEMFLGATRNLQKQLAYARRRGATIAVIQGSDELNWPGEERVQLKDMLEGAKAYSQYSSFHDLRAERPGQFAVKRADLVEEIRELLARQRGES